MSDVAAIDGGHEEGDNNNFSANLRFTRHSGRACRAGKRAATTVVITPDDGGDIGIE